MYSRTISWPVTEIWSVWSIWFIWFNKREKPDRPAHQLDCSESPLPFHKTPASCVYIPLLSFGLPDLGVDPASLTYFLGIELTQASKPVEPILALLPGVSD